MTLGWVVRLLWIARGWTHCWTICLKLGRSHRSAGFGAGLFAPCPRRSRLGSLGVAPSQHRSTRDRCPNRARRILFQVTVTLAVHTVVPVTIIVGRTLPLRRSTSRPHILPDPNLESLSSKRLGERCRGLHPKELLGLDWVKFQESASFQASTELYTHRL